MRSKQEIRQYMSAVSRQTSAVQRGLWSKRIQECIEDHEKFRSAETVMAFYPLPGEVDLRDLLKTWLSVKRIVLPVVVGDDIRLKVYEGEERMREGCFRILEPDTDEWFEDWQSIDCILVPGVAFTGGGCRLGRGKGYYDRFLPNVPQATKLGVCYPYQLVDEVPMDAYDIRLDGVISCHNRE